MSSKNIKLISSLCSPWIIGFLVFLIGFMLFLLLLLSWIFDTQPNKLTLPECSQQEIKSTTKMISKYQKMLLSLSLKPSQKEFLQLTSGEVHALLLTHATTSDLGKTYTVHFEKGEFIIDFVYKHSSSFGFGNYINGQVTAVPVIEKETTEEGTLKEIQKIKVLKVILGDYQVPSFLYGFLESFAQSKIDEFTTQYSENSCPLFSIDNNCLKISFYPFKLRSMLLHLLGKQIDFSINDKL